jgi:hypothetical protein
MRHAPPITMIPFIIALGFARGLSIVRTQNDLPRPVPPCHVTGDIEG